MLFLKCFYSILRGWFLKWQLLLTSLQWGGLIKRLCDVGKQNTQEWLYFLSINIFAAQTTKGLCIYSRQAVEQKKRQEKKIDQFDLFDLLMTPFVPKHPKRPNWEFKRIIIVQFSIFGSRVDDRVNWNNVLTI